MSRIAERGRAPRLVSRRLTYSYVLLRRCVVIYARDCGASVLPLQVYDTRADVYSWGVLLAELVAQKPPYDGMYLTPTQVTHLV